MSIYVQSKTWQVKQELDDHDGRAEPAVKAPRLDDARRFGMSKELHSRYQLEAMQAQTGLAPPCAGGEEAAAAKAEALAWQRSSSEKYVAGCEGQKAAAERAQALLANAEAQHTTYEELAREEQVRAAKEKKREEKKAERAAALASLQEQEEEIRKRKALLMDLEEKSAAKHAMFLQRSGETSQRLRQHLGRDQPAELPQGPASMGHRTPCLEEQMRATGLPPLEMQAAAPTYGKGSLAMHTGAPEQSHVEVPPPPYEPRSFVMPTGAREQGHVKMQPPPPTPRAPEEGHVQPPPHFVNAPPGLAPEQGHVQPPPPSFVNAHQGLTGATQHVQPPPPRFVNAPPGLAPEQGHVQPPPPSFVNAHQGLATTGATQQVQPPLLGFSAPQAVPAEAPEGHVQPPPPGFVSAPQPTQAEQGPVGVKSTEVPVPLVVPDPGQHIVPPEVATHEDDTLAERKAPMPSQAPHGQTWQAEAPHGHTWRVPAAVPMLPGPRLAPQVPLPSSQHAAPQQVEHLQPLGPTHGNAAENQQTEKTRAALAAANMQGTSMEGASMVGQSLAELSRPEHGLEVPDKKAQITEESRRLERLEEALQQLAALRASNDRLSEQLAQQQVPVQPKQVLQPSVSPALAAAATVPKAVAPMPPPSPQTLLPAPTPKVSPPSPWTPGPVESGLWLQSPAKAGPLLRPGSGVSTPTSDMEMGCTAKGVPACQTAGPNPSTPMSAKAPPLVVPEHAQVVPHMPPTP